MNLYHRDASLNLRKTRAAGSADEALRALQKQEAIKEAFMTHGKTRINMGSGPVLGVVDGGKK